jgi:DNA-binding response OmpR family regulator
MMRRQARIGARIVDLSEREFRLLHHLVRNAGKVVSRESLISDVWGTRCDPRSNVVEVCIRRLRRKLGVEAPIETVRHGGYRIAA